MSSVITDTMRADIGKESPPVTFEVDKAACRMFARAVGYTDPIFFDEEAARRQGYRSILAPFAFLGHPAYDPGRSGDPIAYLVRGSSLKRVLNGGTDVEYFDTVCAGDVLTASSKLIDLSEREGTLGPMLISVTETTFRNQDAKVVAVMRGTGIQY